MTDQSGNDIFHGTSFLQGGNAAYVEQMYGRYTANPSSPSPAKNARQPSSTDDGLAV